MAIKSPSAPFAMGEAKCGWLAPAFPDGRVWCSEPLLRESGGKPPALKAWLVGNSLESPAYPLAIGSGDFGSVKELKKLGCQAIRF